jgi:Family of unknown function (DUF5317)
MILIALAGLCLLSVPPAGGELRRLADLRLHATWLPVTALAAQVVITVIAPSGSPALHRAIHLATYAVLGAFLWLNRRLPGVRVIAAGALSNGLAIAVNGGVMPASSWAERMAGLHVRAGFDNSAHVAHPLLPWLGDIIPWPGPLANVLSIGDCVIYAGVVVLLHRVCARPAAASAPLASAD